jgi:hypothetical protein
MIVYWVSFYDDFVCCVTVFAVVSVILPCVTHQLGGRNGNAGGRNKNLIVIMLPRFNFFFFFNQPILQLPLFTINPSSRPENRDTLPSSHLHSAYYLQTQDSRLPLPPPLLLIPPAGL